MRGKMFATSLAAIVATSLATSPATALAQPAAAPDLATARQWFEAGKDQQIVAIELKDDSPPALVYLVAQGHARLQQRAQARAAYDRLAARPQTDPWHFIGRSAVLLGDAQLIPGVTAAEQGVQLGPKVAETHFQLGLAYGDNQDWAKAAPAFEAAIAVDPMLAYAHYYAGHSYYEAGRIDLMAKFFEYFLRLAPGAPERTNVESIMRTVRGRR
jgi:tetratricopeptide (TPR) repeat protein